MSISSNVGRPPFRRAYAFGLITGLFFLLSWAGQFVTQLYSEMHDAAEHAQPFEFTEFLIQFGASTFENWQSEFLQLIWQAAGLAALLYWNSSQSREGDDRIEAKIDALCQSAGLDPLAISEATNRAA